MAPEDWDLPWVAAPSMTWSSGSIAMLAGLTIPELAIHDRIAGAQLG